MFLIEPAYTYRCNLVSIYDGDTIRVDIDLGFGIIKANQSIRFYGIDTPEISGDEREEGLVSKKFVVDLDLGSKEMIIQTMKDKTGKYGRWLGVIWYKTDTFWTNLNEELLKNGLAKPY